MFVSFHSMMILRIAIHKVAGTKRVHAAAQPMHRKEEGNPHRLSSKPRTDEVIETRMYFCERFVGLGHEQAWRLDCECADCEEFRPSLSCSRALLQKRCK
ncbi:hypothetical protein K443DRAFT_414989 [Laccaria amethystina LaAM-08-1]|uniref:Uncharacterized protein n=1 Tax=Laccaria amethystina LaAM-08-1 TaxID=1095629 RepID=A0A0C9WW05_9AGAR|nr:hypothetical protein K443DRAFT_414989 [Laccaria amethystina LaAM-08-1]